MFRRFRHHRSGISPTEDVYLVDVTERWNDDRHGYWAFTDPTWFTWGTEGGAAPASLRKAATSLPARFGVVPPGDDASAQDRAGYVVWGAFADGEFAGRGTEARDEWLAGRRPLGVLTRVEDTPQLLDGDVSDED